MNNKLSQFARDQLKQGLKNCTKREVLMFKRMYGKSESEIDKVVNNIPDEKLDWAMQQIEKTLKNRK